MLIGTQKRQNLGRTFLTEMSTGVSIFAFNWVLLKLSGNAAVAAYGVIANITLVVLALSNGIRRDRSTYHV